MKPKFKIACCLLASAYFPELINVKAVPSDVSELSKRQLLQRTTSSNIFLHVWCIFIKSSSERSTHIDRNLCDINFLTSVRYKLWSCQNVCDNERQAFFTSEDTKRYKLWSCQNVCEALIHLLDNIYIRFGTKLYRQIVGIPTGTNCAPLVADLFLFCYERNFMTSLSDVKQAEIIEAFKSTSRYLDDLLNIDNPYFEGMVNRIYPPELQLNKANTSDTEAPFFDLHLSISNGFVSSKIYDKRDDFDFDIVNFPFLDVDVPRSTSYGVYISQLIRFARVSSHVVDLNARNKSLTAKLLQQGYRYHKLRKTFSKFYRRHYELVSKFNVGLKTLLHQGLSEPEFYSNLVYKFKKIVGRVDFSDQFRKIIVRYKRIEYNINIMRQSACLVFNPITVNNFASLFNCTPVGRASDSMMAPT